MENEKQPAVSAKLSDHIKIDDERDILFAYGNPMTGDLLRCLCEATPEGVWFRIVQDRDGSFHVERGVLETQPRTKAAAH